MPAAGLFSKKIVQYFAAAKKTALSLFQKFLGHKEH